MEKYNHVQVICRGGWTGLLYGLNPGLGMGRLIIWAERWHQATQIPPAGPRRLVPHYVLCYVAVVAYHVSVDWVILQSQSLHATTT
jgi:hypothetical protein